jgi:hypothetical protein
MAAPDRARPKEAFMDKHPQPRGRLTEPKVVATAMTVGLGALAGLAAYSMLVPAQARHRGERAQRNPDDAPGRSAKKARFGDMAVTGPLGDHRPRQGRGLRLLPRLREPAPLHGEHRGRGRERGRHHVWTIRAPWARPSASSPASSTSARTSSSPGARPSRARSRARARSCCATPPAGAARSSTSIVAYKPPWAPWARPCQAPPGRAVRSDAARPQAPEDAPGDGRGRHQRQPALRGPEGPDAVREEA